MAYVILVWAGGAFSSEAAAKDSLGEAWRSPRDLSPKRRALKVRFPWSR